ncbi:hypothetical protein FEE95_04170 [Maribacter algarum]|uniref:Outer membrane lipoprotein-sorting protein n=1 Tax=Maribacter algarum (ex Zhang et al. 2020) TaxID=2578118 RepID=A0A5S3PUG8_9FLAO|nr:hypothetical protein [Maribacter algarum]TMM58635.1 hypothetical protein FEE95_04170 [Maribacter algarum]
MKQAVFLVTFCIATLFGCKDKSTQKEIQKALTATQIMKKAHEKAGGAFWQKPKSLAMKGHAIFYRDGKVSKHETHNMWRVFESTKEDAHVANGKVRIESFKDSTPVFIVSFDGEHTYDLRGKQGKSDADARWASNFGYGAIRHALDAGYTLKLVEDDMVKTKPAYTIQVTDPNKGETFFGIDKEDFKIVKVAFQTPQGWHHREYSAFFSKEKYSWLQSGRVELFYDGKISNEVFWTDFEVNETLPDSLFVLESN